MEKQQKKRIKKYISWFLLVVMVALLAVMPLLASNQQLEEGPQASILRGTVGRADISTTLVGGGTLAGETAEEITIPAAVKLTAYGVKNGDSVKKGDTIAKVDRVSVMSAISQVQDALDTIEEELEDNRNDRQSESVKAIAEGVVKVVYAREGESAQDVMLRDGALAALSLDGLMAVQIQSDTSLVGGDEVIVILSDGTEVNGRVESNVEGVLTVTVKDDDYECGEAVTVTTVEGDRIGTGELYIHSRWNAVAYSGVISDIRISEGETVRAGRTLMTLKETERTAHFEALSSQHREYSDLMLELFRLYQTEAITAPCDGVVTGVDENGIFMLSADGGWQVNLLANAPNGDDESTYVNFVGLVWGVGIDGLVMKMNPQQLSITDYKDLSAVPTDPALMTEDVIYAAQAPVYELQEDEWVQIDSASLIPGDMLLFAGDDGGNFVWVVRIGRGYDVPELPEETVPEETTPEEPTEPADPQMPTEPGTPEEPTAPTNPEDVPQQTLPGQGGIQFPQMGGGGLGGILGGIIPEEEEELYPLETLTVATVTAQDKMKLIITVDELDISHISLGQTAVITLDALVGQSFEATVTEIAGTGINAGGNSKFSVTLTLDKAEDMLPGMTASAVITLDTAENVLCVPVAAVTELGTKTLLYTGYDEENEVLTNPVEVTTGVSDGQMVQILSGAAEGMSFSYAYYDQLVVSLVPKNEFDFFGQ